MEESLWRLLAATAVGFLVGFEREHARAERELGWLGGLRTYAAIGLLGGALGLLDEPLPLAAGILALGGLAVWSLSREPGATSEVAALATYVLGALAGGGRVAEGLFGALLLTGLLAFRRPLHAWARGVDASEFGAGVLLLLLLGVIWPLLPDRPLGPGGVWNPREIGFFVILVAAIQFAGFLATRRYGRQGAVLAALFGGLASSTAVTLAMARQAREDPLRVPLWAGAAALASVLMLGRIAFWFLIADPPALAPGLGPLLLWTGWNLAAALALVRRAPPGRPRLDLKNPLGLEVALIGAGFYALVRWAVVAASGAGALGLFLVALVAGLHDVDAISLSLARSAAAGELAPRTALLAAFVAGLSNDLLKSVYAALFGRGWMGLYHALATLPGGLAATAWLLLG